MQSINNIEDNSFDELYKSYFQGLYHFAWHYVMCDEARDIVQDVFISFYESKSKLPPDTNIVGYLLTATRNRCMNFLRRQDVIDRHENRLVEAIISWNNDTHEEHLELTRLFSQTRPFRDTGRNGSNRKNMFMISIVGNAGKFVRGTMHPCVTSREIVPVIYC